MISPDFSVQQRTRIQDVFESFIPRLQEYNSTVVGKSIYKHDERHLIFASIEFLSAEGWPHYDAAMDVTVMNRGNGKLTFRTEINERFSDALLIEGPAGSIDVDDPNAERWVSDLVCRSVRFFEDHFDDVRDKVCPDNPSGRDLR